MPLATIDHTTRTFDADLQVLARMTTEMGGYAEKQIVEAVDALERGDRELGRRVVSDDIILDAQQREIERKAIATIALRQPMAVDLRSIIGALKIANDLERVGDLAKNIGKRAAALDSARLVPRTLPGVVDMTNLTVCLLRDALDSYSNRDRKKAVEVWFRDEEIDARCKFLSEEMLDCMMDDPRVVTFGIHLLFCVKNMECIGDHATNIAESVYYIVEGHALMDERPKADSTKIIRAEVGDIR